LAAKPLVNCKSGLERRRTAIIVVEVLSLPCSLLSYCLLFFSLWTPALDHEGLRDVISLVAELVHSIEELVKWSFFDVGCLDGLILCDDVGDLKVRERGKWLLREIVCAMICWVIWMREIMLV
jgi:hypothetical protein